MAAMAAAIYLISEMKVVLLCPGLVPASRSDQVCVASHYIPISKYHSEESDVRYCNDISALRAINTPDNTAPPWNFSVDLSIR